MPYTRPDFTEDLLNFRLFIKLGTLSRLGARGKLPSMPRPLDDPDQFICNINCSLRIKTRGRATYVERYLEKRQEKKKMYNYTRLVQYTSCMLAVNFFSWHIVGVFTRRESICGSNTQVFFAFFKVQYSKVTLFLEKLCLSLWNVIICPEVFPNNCHDITFRLSGTSI